ncbi:MAG: anti-sigma factor family protein, partial [Planctomycetota bacterium]
MSKNPNQEEQNRFREARLTAYLLDELEAEDRATVEAELAADAGLCRELEALSATVALVRGAVPPARLDDERRESLKRLAESAAAGAPPRGRLVAFRRAAAAAAVLLVVGGMAWFGARGWKSAEAPREEKVVRALKKSEGGKAPDSTPAPPQRFRHSRRRSTRPSAWVEGPAGTLGSGSWPANLPARETTSRS